MAYRPVWKEGRLAFALLTVAAALFFSGAAASRASARDLTLLTFNVWDIGIVEGRYAAERLPVICDRLKTAAADDVRGWDVVLIQELWPRSRRHALDHCGYAHVADLEDYFANPINYVAAVLDFFGTDLVLDSGLRILSRFPILETKRHTYSVNGALSHALDDGEYFARKSAIAAKIVHPEWGPVWIVNTHMVAQYADDRYAQVRERQLRELRAWIAAALGDAPVILGGDLNLGPKVDPDRPSRKYREAVWDRLFPTLFAGFTSAAGADRACTICGGGNSFQKDPARRDKVDHIFVDRNFDVTDGRVAMNETVPVYLPAESRGFLVGAAFGFGNVEGAAPRVLNLSDHFGWESTVRLK